MSVRFAPGRPPIRQSRAVRNDNRILDAALSQADEAGWAGMSLLPIAERAGLARATTRARFRSRSLIGAAVWTQRIAQPLTTLLTAVVNACPRPGSTPDVNVLQSALTPFIESDETLRAAAELLVVGRYDPYVGDAIEETLGPHLQEWLTVRRGHPRAQAARNAYLLLLALGLMVHGRRSPLLADDLISQTIAIGHALANQASPIKLPADRVEHIAGPIDFGTDDPAWERLLQTTIDQVGAVGYEAATVEVITEAAGCTRGLLFGRYDSKWDLFTDATERMLAASVNANNEYQRRLTEQYGEGIAEAAIMRELMRPEFKSARTVSLEQVRLSWHDESLLAQVAASYAEATWQLTQEQPEKSAAQMRAYLHVGMAVGLGVTAMADLFPQAASLPMDVVTVPLLGAR